MIKVGIIWRTYNDGFLMQNYRYSSNGVQGALRCCTWYCALECSNREYYVLPNKYVLMNALILGIRAFITPIACGNTAVLKASKLHKKVLI